MIQSEKDIYAKKVKKLVDDVKAQSTELTGESVPRAYDKIFGDLQLALDQKDNKRASRLTKELKARLVREEEEPPDLVRPIFRYYYRIYRKNPRAFLSDSWGISLVLCRSHLLSNVATQMTFGKNESLTLCVWVYWCAHTKSPRRWFKFRRSHQHSPPKKICIRITGQVRQSQMCQDLLHQLNPVLGVFLPSSQAWPDTT